MTGIARRFALLAACLLPAALCLEAGSQDRSSPQRFPAGPASSGAFGSGGSAGAFGSGGSGGGLRGDLRGSEYSVYRNASAEELKKMADGLNIPAVTTDNKNTLVLAHRKKLQLSASTTWQGWPEAFAFDGSPYTSWFSGQDDAAAKGRKPWLQLTFPEDVKVKRVTVLGNRDPFWPRGFTILAGSVELLDAKGKRLGFEENDGIGNAYDYDFRFFPPVVRVRAIRFHALGDQGQETTYGDIAIGEIQVE
jgi:hypothetical protein